MSASASHVDPVDPDDPVDPVDLSFFSCLDVFKLFKFQRKEKLKFSFFEMSCLVVVQLSWPRVPSRYKGRFWSWSNCLLELFKSVRLETPRFTDLPRVLPWRIRHSSYPLNCIEKERSEC